VRSKDELVPCEIQYGPTTLTHVHE
jgi:hypothetical protein